MESCNGIPLSISLTEPMKRNTIRCQVCRTHDMKQFILDDDSGLDNYVCSPECRSLLNRVQNATKEEVDSMIEKTMKQFKQAEGCLALLQMRKNYNDKMEMNMSGWITKKSKPHAPPPAVINTGDFKGKLRDDRRALAAHWEETEIQAIINEEENVYVQDQATESESEDSDPTEDDIIQCSMTTYKRKRQQKLLMQRLNPKRLRFDSE